MQCRIHETVPVYHPIWGGRERGKRWMGDSATIGAEFVVGFTGEISQSKSTTSSKERNRFTVHQVASPSSQDHGFPCPTALHVASSLGSMGMAMTSQGLRCYVPNVDLVVQDCLSFNLIKQDTNFDGLPCVVLVAPMVKISDKVTPRWPIPQALTFISNFLPTLAIVPTEDLLHKSIKVEEKKIVGNINPFRYRGKPRLGIVVELLRNVVTDPEVSRTLYEEASSQDKTFKIYEGMWHSLLFGEPDENIEVVRSDVLSWLNDRCYGGRFSLSILRLRCDAPCLVLKEWEIQFVDPAPDLGLQA
ncbi:hypothetical protein F3Y22_tig00110187pilonHSYRG00313 [Hibiscus syriacus]|uniref:Serine aminopeptidase S33 domain-containing protein n=1 Tax=Hibiscus syriacus TaxID=106335 RepID=A0A6A3BE88_HIBSY|nr:hypothetical protein F3Y22_tig00110187pilonHSYRG00313 [Hibiscus syriacus]